MFKRIEKKNIENTHQHYRSNLKFKKHNTNKIKIIQKKGISNIDIFVYFKDNAI